MNGVESESLGTYTALIQAGERVLEAMEEERRFERLLRRGAGLEVTQALSEARRRVDTYAAEYCRILDACGYPDLPIRYVIEGGQQSPPCADNG